MTLDTYNHTCMYYVETRIEPTSQLVENVLLILVNTILKNKCLLICRDMK